MKLQRRQLLFLLATTATATATSSPVAAFTSTSPSFQCRSYNRHKHQGSNPCFREKTVQLPTTCTSSQLSYTDDDNNNNGSSNKSNNIRNHDSVRRTAMKGISVSPSGFLTLLETRNRPDKKIIVPIRITSTQKDAYATTSAESLTICQLLSGVDMAGAILSPDVLKHIVGLYCSSFAMEENEEEEEENLFDQIIIEDELGLEMPIPNSDTEEEEEGIVENDDFVNDFFHPNSKNQHVSSSSSSTNSFVKEFVHDFLKTSLGPNTNSFEEASVYQRSRAIFPKISLDSIRIDLPSLAIPSTESISISPPPSTTLWKDMVMDRVMMQQQKENSNHDKDDSTLQTFEKDSLVPIPLQFVLECRIDGDKTLDVPLFSEIDTITKYIAKQQQIETEEQPLQTLSSIMTTVEESRSITQQVLYSYDESCSGAFLAMSLALRYKCPIVISSTALDKIESLQDLLEKEKKMTNKNKVKDGDNCNEFDSYLSICIQQAVKSDERKKRKVGENKKGNNSPNAADYDDNDDDNDDDKALQSLLPQWRSTNALQSQSQRVVENIEQGFQLTKLQGALKIALQRGDELAAKKIRAEIQKLLGNE